MSSPADKSFLAEIIANPGDEFPRLVYGDWLERNGDDHEAELWRKGDPIVVFDKLVRAVMLCKGFTRSDAIHWIALTHADDYIRYLKAVKSPSALARTRRLLRADELNIVNEEQREAVKFYASTPTMRSDSWVRRAHDDDSR